MRYFKSGALTTRVRDTKNGVKCGSAYQTVHLGQNLAQQSLLGTPKNGEKNHLRCKQGSNMGTPARRKQTTQQIIWGNRLGTRLRFMKCYAMLQIGIN